MSLTPRLVCWLALTEVKDSLPLNSGGNCALGAHADIYCASEMAAWWEEADERPKGGTTDVEWSLLPSASSSHGRFQFVPAAITQGLHEPKQFLNHLANTPFGSRKCWPGCAVNLCAAWISLKPCSEYSGHRSSDTIEEADS